MALATTKRPKIYTSVSSGIIGLFLLWMGFVWLAPGEQFRVSLGVGDDEGAWNRHFLYLYSEGSLGKTISPINVFMVATVTNTSQNPIRIVSYSARIKPDDGWLTPWVRAVVIPIGAVVTSADSQPYRLTLQNMKTVRPSLPMLSMLSDSQSQIEAKRHLDAWFALEYPDHLVAAKNHKIELEIVSDFGGVAHGLMDTSKTPDPHDSASLITTPSTLSFREVLNLSDARFMYWSDIQTQLKAIR
jgi:hypothetical protein